MSFYNTSAFPLKARLARFPILGILAACFLAPAAAVPLQSDSASSASLAETPKLFVRSPQEERDSVPPRKVWEETRAKHRGEGPPLLIVDPRNGETYNSDEVRFGGCTEPGSEVTVNGIAARVYSSGAFAGMTQLRPGKNPIVFRATLKGKSTTVSINVSRSEPSKPLPKEPLKIETTRNLTPDSDLHLLEGDVLRVRCQGSPGATAWFRLGWGRKRHEMPELPVGKGGVSIPGIYEGVYVIGPDDDYVDAAISVTLQATVSGRSRTVSEPARGRLTTDPKHVRRFARVVVEDSGLYTDLSTAVRVTSVPTGTLLELDGLRGSFYRVRLGGETRHAWVYSKNAKIASKKEIVPPPRFREAILEEDPVRGDAILSIFLDDVRDEKAPLPPIPFRVETAQAGTTLTLTIWGLDDEFSDNRAAVEPLPRPPGAERVLAADATDWQSPQSALVRSIRRRPTREGTGVFEMALQTRQCWGYEATLDQGVLRLRVKTSPRIFEEPERPLAGLKIFLDAGHGGADAGAIGPGGLREADANLAISERLANLLERAGARVEKTRSDDRTVSLEERIERVWRSDADFFLSIHNNSVSASRNPLAVSGPFFFFYYGHGADPTRRLYEALTEQTGFPRQIMRVQHHWFRPMRLCPQMPCALAEVVFLSNPEDEMLLLQSAFLDNVSTGLYKGIADFFQRRPFPLADAAPEIEKPVETKSAESEKTPASARPARARNVEEVRPDEISLVNSVPVKKAGGAKIPVAAKK